MESIKPLIMAHKGGDCFGTENALSSIRESIKIRAELIEIDIRKSTDNILFAYHGNPVQFMFPKYFFKKEFKDLKIKYPEIATLDEIVKEVGNKTTLFLDIKDNSITKEDIIKSLNNLNLPEIYIAHRSLRYHEQLGNLPSNWKKVINLGYIYSQSKVKRMAQAGIYAIELFRWDFTRKNIDLLRDNGIDVALPRVFLNSKEYMDKCLNEKTLWVTGFDLPRVIEYIASKRQI